MTTSPDRRPAERGFTILELLIALVIAVEILIGAAVAFDVHNRMTQIQTQITDMQQSLRIAHYDLNRMVRMAGRGDLPARIDPQGATRVPPQLTGYAIDVRNNVGGTVNADPDRNIARGDADTPLVVRGTDVLIVRGCFSNLYQINPADFFSGDGTGTPTLTIPKLSFLGFTQTLTPLVQATDAAGDDASIGRLAMVSPENLQTYGIADVTDITFSGGTDDDPDSATLTLDLGIGSLLNVPDTSVVPAVNAFPSNMAASTVCMLEELRYYIREEFDVTGDNTTPLRPRLARARFLPGTETLLDEADLADGIFDLQIAFGFDSDYPAAGVAPGSFDDDIDFINVDDSIFEAPPGDAARATDDWLFNSPADRPTDVQWLTHANQGTPLKAVQLTYVRVTALARTSRADPSYQAPDFDTVNGSDFVEDNDYDAAPANYFKTGIQPKYRRRGLTTVIDLRNL